MGISLKPQTIMGKWSTGLIIAFFLFLAVFHILVVSGQRGGDTFLSNLTLTIPIMLAWVSAMSALVTGLIGVVKNGERSVPTFLAILIGLFVLIFSLGEVLFPH